MKPGTQHSLCFSRLTCEPAYTPATVDGAHFKVPCRTLCPLLRYQVYWCMSTCGIGTTSKVVRHPGCSYSSSSDVLALSNRRQMDDVHKCDSPFSPYLDIADGLVSS